jgi:hypothetical protein
MSVIPTLDQEDSQLERISLIGLMVAMVTWLMLTPLVIDRTWMTVIHLVIFYGVLALTFNVTVHRQRMRRLIFIGLLIIAVADLTSELIGLRALSPGRRFLSWLAAAYLLFAPVLLTVEVLRAQRVTMNVVFGALCAYFLMGIFWGVLFSEIASSSTQAFRFPGGEQQPLDIMYFSFTTLTTLGYGDITPQTSLLKILATMEAFIGQVYLVVLVARLVSLQIADRNR